MKSNLFIIVFIIVLKIR